MSRSPAGAGPPEEFDPARLALADPYPVYRRYRETDPVHAVRPRSGSGPTTWYLFGHAEVARVLTDRGFGRRNPSDARAAPVPEGYATLRRIVENWLVFLDPPRHTRLRALVAPPLGTAAVGALRPRVREIAEELVGPLARRPVAELVEGFAAPYPLLVVAGLLGVKGARWPWFRAEALALQRAGGTRGDRSPAALDRADRAAAELDAYFGRGLAARRTEGHGDLLSALARAGAEDPALGTKALTATCVHLLTAGHETTTGLIGKAVLSLLARPDVGEELRADPGLLPKAVDEFLRHDPPVQMVTRWAHRDAELAGRSVRRGDRLRLVLGSAHRDPARFPDPDTLDIHREGGRHCAFGIHYCVGAALARAEAEIGLGVLLDRLPALGRGARPGVEVEYAPDWVFHGPSRLTLSC
ncbi:cytochrome P450 [Streptomyces vietnamensis]|uniref:Cytochrome P450 n=1 Tax=Streptomyces vietnamensis TaxID=362257 RepID=A0A0B5I6J5_9ACTN|nr:cytochrome P450 [Streptomyces vietnamensis]AJF63914.1 cytochrome P450 [Streptomyces vietnamensis]